MKMFIQKSEIFLAAALTVLVILSYVAYEPAFIDAQSTQSQFIVSQAVTAEISFSTPASNVTLSPAINGITGGTSNGGTQFVVTTNNTTGYNVTVTASSSLGMINSVASSTIAAYVPSSGITPDFTFTAPANTSRFGYTVEASSTLDLDTAFKDNGSTCGAGSADASLSCWVNASTTARTIINRSTSTPTSGATSTIRFRAQVQSNPVPTVPSGSYYATTTLTATVNP